MPPPLQASPEVGSDASASPQRHLSTSDRNHLAPEDAFFTNSPPRWHRQPEPTNGINGVSKADSPRGPTRSRRRRDRDRGRSGSRRRIRTWKKLLWVKQSYPDNYTDEETFLSQLQRNPRFQPYDFWPLVADSTVIVQHVCSVIIFACCFVGIHQGRVSPVSVVSWGSLGTVLGWVMWDWWVVQEEAGSNGIGESNNGEGGEAGSSASSTTGSVSHGTQSKEMNGAAGLGLKLSTSASNVQRPSHSHSTSATSVHSNASLPSPIMSLQGNGSASFGYHGLQSQYGTSTSLFSPRNQQRLATAKSAILIYYALLGLSPILKSLTRSTTSDSIWAMSAWLMCINVFFFDYGGEVK
ncbi:MAG: hypothetical protein M1839_000645 [Geoglossum umbratile]|nr:MAG: hypothetical protein M1839_000645 [Geoglossum umbratile]